MKKGLTELVFIIDRSGSMSGLEADTIGGFNSLLEKQKSEPGEANITTVLFDDEYEVLHDRIDQNDVKKITSKDYFVRGYTALLDAIGRTINKVEKTQEKLPKKERAENVLVVITTDGMENASREYSVTKIKTMIKEKTEKNGWEFLFIGANIDAIKTAGSFGISSDHAMQYAHDPYGIAAKYGAMEKAVGSVRRSESITPDWKETGKNEKQSDKQNKNKNNKQTNNQNTNNSKQKKESLLSRLRKFKDKN